MGKYDDLIGGGKLILDVEEILNEESAKKVDDRIKKQKAELEKPIEINVKSNKAENQLKALHKAAQKVKDDLQDAISSQKGFEEVNKLVTKYGHLKKQIGDIAPVVGKNNATLKESNKILKDTKKLVDQLTVSQDKLNAARGAKNSSVTRQEAKVIKESTKMMNDATKAQTQEQINIELEKELKVLKAIEEQEKRNDAAREQFKKKQANYGKEVFGVDHVVYDTDLIKGARKELEEFNDMLATRNKFQEKYAKLSSIIYKYYLSDELGKYAIGNGMYKNFDQFYDHMPDMKRLAKLADDFQHTTNKAIDEMFTNVVRSLKSELSTVSKMLDSGDVLGDTIGQQLEQEEIALNQEMQRLYNERIAQENKIAALKKQELDLIIEQGKQDFQGPKQQQILADATHKATEEIKKEADAIDNVIGKMPKMESVIKRYNKLMTTIGKEHVTIGTQFSDGRAEGWNLRDMVSEAEYWLKEFYNNEEKPDDADEAKIFLSEKAKLQRFIDAYEPFVGNMITTQGHGQTRFDNTPQVLEKQLSDVEIAIQKLNNMPLDPWKIKSEEEVNNLLAQRLEIIEEIGEAKLKAYSVEEFEGIEYINEEYASRIDSFKEVNDDKIYQMIDEQYGYTSDIVESSQELESLLVNRINALNDIYFKDDDWYKQREQENQVIRERIALMKELESLVAKGLINNDTLEEMVYERGTLDERRYALDGIKLDLYNNEYDLDDAQEFLREYEKILVTTAGGKKLELGPEMSQQDFKAFMNSDAERAKSIEFIRKEQDQLTSTIEQQVVATEKLTEARLKLTPKKKGDYTVPETYVSEDGKFEVSKGQSGWDVYQRDNAGLYSFIANYKTLNNVRDDASLLTREEIVLSDELVKEIKTLQEAYRSMGHEVQGTKTVVDKYLEVLHEVKSGAMSAADAIKQLNSVAGNTQTKQKNKPVVDTLEDLSIGEKLLELERITGMSVTKMLSNYDSLESGIKSKVNTILQSLGLMNEQLQFTFEKTHGGTSKAILGPDFVILQKSIESSAEFTNDLISKLREAQQTGINVMPVLERVASTLSSQSNLDDNKLVPGYEIQQRGYGDILHASSKVSSLNQALQENEVILKASHEQLVKFINDWIGLDRQGIQIDPSKGGNFLYSIEHGFSFIDLTLQKTKGEAKDLQTIFNEITTMLSNMNGFYSFGKDNDLGLSSAAIINKVSSVFEQIGLATNAELNDWILSRYDGVGNIHAQPTTMADQVKAIEDAYEAADKKLQNLEEQLSAAIKEQEELEKHAKLYGYTLGMAAREAGKIQKTLAKDNRAQYVTHMLGQGYAPIQVESGTYGFDRPDLGQGVYNPITKTEYDYSLYLLKAVGDLNVGWDEGLQILASQNGQLDEAAKKVIQLNEQLTAAMKEEEVAYERMSYAHAGILGDDNIAAYKQRLAGKDSEDNVAANVSASANAIEAAQEDIAESTTQTNETVIRSYDELLKATTRYVELAKQLKPTSTPEYDEVDRAIDSSRYLDDIDEAIAQVTSWYTNVQRLKSSKKQGLSRYMHTYSDGEQREFEIENDSLQRAESTLQGYIYRAFADFGFEFVDALKKSSTKKIQSFVDKTLDKYFKVVDANEAYEIQASAFNRPIKEVMTNIYETIMSSVGDATKRDAEEILDDLQARPNRVNRYTLSSETGRLGRYMGIATPYDEAVSNAKKIESYKELCEVLGTYHELLSRNYVYSGDNPPGFSESEEQLFREMKARITATGGKDIWKQANFGEFNTDKLATALGIELPKAADVAEQNISEVREELQALNEEASNTNAPQMTQGKGGGMNQLVAATPNDLAAQQTAEAIHEAEEAIRLEGVAAEQAEPKKKKFARANKEVAQSGLITKDGVEQASGAMENEGKSAQQYADEIINTIKRINSLNVEIDSLKGKNKNGIFNDQITSMQRERSQLLSTIGSIAQEVNNQFNLGFADDYASNNSFEVITRFFAQAGDAAEISSQDVNKFVDAVRSAEKFAAELNNRYQETFNNISNLRSSIAGFGIEGLSLNDDEGKDDGSSDYYLKTFDKYLKSLEQYDVIKAKLSGTSPIDWTAEQSAEIDAAIASVQKYGNAIKQMQDVEAKYFSGKTRYEPGQSAESLDEFFNKQVTSAGDAQKKLADAAKEFAQESGFGEAYITKFTQSANGISKLDFSVFDRASGQLRNFSMEMGRTTDNIYRSESTINKSLAKIQAAQKQLGSTQDLLGVLGQSGVTTTDGSGAAPKIQELLTLSDRLSKAISDGADETIITKLTKDLKFATAETEKMYKQMLQLDDAIASGQVKDLGKGDAGGNVYNQLVDATKNLVGANQNATVECGRFDAATNTLNASLVHANGTVEHFKVSMNGLNGQMTAQQSGVSKLTSTWDRFKASLGQAGKQLMTAFAGYNVFYKAISEVRKGVGYVKEIDLALTELKKVTDETEASYAKFLDTAASTAGKIGSTVSDFTEATSNFARLGYTMEESANMAETAIVYRNVADGLDTVEEATDSIISTMKAFGIESNNTMGIVDRFNEVGNNFAITSAGIGEALQRSASALYAGGNTIDESIALVTAANSVIQNPEQVGG